MRRGQLSLSVMEAGIGVLLLTAVAAGFFLVGDGADGRAAAQLDTYAHDTAVVLTAAGDGGPQVDRALRSAAAWETNRTAIRNRAAALLPANVLFRVETPHGAVGYPAPENRPVGVERVPTAAGTVTVRVWYP
ncbi:MAG: hypothetical protein ABEJ68_06640 [Halobacteriaceae archaeon]